VELIAMVMRAQFGAVVDSSMNWILMIVNTCSVMIWAAYIVQPVRRASPSAAIPDSSRLEEWNRALMELLRK
jgi:hypothetical protein